MIYRYWSLLQKKGRSASRDIVVIDLNKDDGGLNILTIYKHYICIYYINKLEALYVKDKKASAYIAHERFETFQSTSDTNITDYLNEFERLYHERLEMSLRRPY